jgi:hypothetical protein
LVILTFLHEKGQVRKPPPVGLITPFIRFDNRLRQVMVVVLLLLLPPPPPPQLLLLLLLFLLCCCCCYCGSDGLVRSCVFVVVLLLF